MESQNYIFLMKIDQRYDYGDDDDDDDDDDYRHDT
jgi:hypothetical protein